MQRIILLVTVALLMPLPAAAQKAPAGYVVSLDLSGADRTALARDGQKLAPKLMMPLYDGDVVLLRDPKSRVGIETGAGERIDVGGTRPRFEVKGEFPTGGDASAVMSALASELGKAEVAQGGAEALKLPMAVRGPNFLVKSDRPLWLAWTGGTAPFKVIVEVDGRARVHGAIRERSFAVDVPETAGKRFEIVIKDAANGLSRNTFRFRDRLPEPPAALSAAARGRTSAKLALAAWLTTLHEGDWSVEAAQILHDGAAGDQASAALLNRITAGWKLN